MKLIEKLITVFVGVASFVGPFGLNVWADDDFAPVREETILSDEQIEELLKLSRGRGSVSAKTTFSASETKEFSAYLFALFFVEFDRKLNEYKRLADKAIVRMRLDLDYEFPSILPVSIASSEDVETKAGKIASDAEPFVHIYAGKRAAKKMERLVKSYFNDEIEFAFIPLDGAADDAPLVVACNPKKQKWTVWMEFESLGTNDTDLNLYYLSEGPIFGPEFENEKKQQHVLVLKQRLKRERERALKARRDAERNARAAARNAERVSRQNATIQGSREMQRRLGN